MEYIIPVEMPDYVTNKKVKNLIRNFINEGNDTFPTFPNMGIYIKHLKNKFEPSDKYVIPGSKILAMDADLANYTYIKIFIPDDIKDFCPKGKFLVRGKRYTKSENRKGEPVYNIMGIISIDYIERKK